MKMRSQRLFRTISDPRFAQFLAVLGGLVYLVQSWFYAHTQTSIMDEGAYLLKGYLFATGKYQPFQEYGPWTNHMPFSYLIPGWAQLIFGPGLRTGRYLAIVLGVGMLLGVWVLSRRVGNRWWAAGLIWLLALNQPVLRVYSMMTSQVLVSCILVWILVLVIGPGRPTWQLNLGVVMSAFLLLTRINMAPVLPLVLVYIFWEQGVKTGFYAVITGVLAVAIGHAFFWPGILKLWAAWSPIDFPFLDVWKAPSGSAPLWNPEIDLYGRILSLLLSLRIHFTSLMGILTVLLMWPAKREWRSEWRYRVAVFLGVSFTLLFGIHAWASLGKSYCVYCLPNYMMFFQLFGILFVCVAFNSWRGFNERAGKWLFSTVILCVSLGVGYSLVIGKQITGTWIGGRLYDFVNLLWHIEVPRIKSMRIEPGSVELWGIFANKLDWMEKQILDGTLLLVTLLMSWFLLYQVAKWLGRHLTALTRVNYSTGAIQMLVFLSFGTIITLRMGFVPQESDCGWDVISSYEAGGAYLVDNIPSGSKIFWRGTSAVPLLYLDDYEIYPPQLNDVYSYFLGGDPDELARYGRWNPELDLFWQQDADVILIERSRGVPDIDMLDELVPTPPMLPCNPNSKIHIYVHK